MTHLVDHVDEGLGVAPIQATDHVALILTREYCLDQGGNFTSGERASDQTFTGWSIEVGRDERIGVPLVFHERGVEDAPLSVTGMAAVLPEVTDGEGMGL